MQEKPEVRQFADGSRIWSHSFDKFEAKVYVPLTTLPEKIINFGFEAPYLLVFEENKMSEADAKTFADTKGLSKIASEHASSVVFIYPTNAGGWENADESLFTELIANSKIHMYYEDGYAILNNRFFKTFEGYAIRGAIFRTYLYGYGKSADYIALNLLKTIQGEGLWGPADVTPAVCVLENLSVEPKFERNDMPVISVGNSDAINEIIEKNTRYSLVTQENDYAKTFNEFVRKYKRWVGNIQIEPDFESMKLKKAFGCVNVETSPDNCGDDKDTKRHDIGYLSFYNEGLLDNGPVPTLICFHGGGDSAMYIAYVSEWYRVAHDHNFLLICIENHILSTATEMVEFIDKVSERYPIDKTRIYGSGFSMGGCKSWDLYQEYPQVFAGLAPMSATFDVGFNVFGNKVDKEINKDVLVPIFYAGGEITPLPELPFQEQKCLDRMQYVLKINKSKKHCEVKLEDKDKWENPIWGINGDFKEEFYDPNRDATLTVQYFESEDGNVYTAFGSISGQGHECRYHTCDTAWKFLSKFKRVDGDIIVE